MLEVGTYVRKFCRKTFIRILRKLLGKICVVLKFWESLTKIVLKLRKSGTFGKRNWVEGNFLGNLKI